MPQPYTSNAWAHILVALVLILVSGQLSSQCGSTVLGTSGNPFPLNIGTEDQCAANSLAVPTPNASQQSNVTPLGCGATQQRDIWFIFTATATTTVINLYSVALANMGFMVYNAPCGAAMDLISCVGYDLPAAYTTRRSAFNTVPGNQYYVRVSRQGSNAFDGGLFGPANNMRICGWSWVRPPDELTCEASFESGSATPEWICRYGFYNFNWNFPNSGCLNPGGVNAPLDAGNGIDQGIPGGNRHTIISDKLYLDPRTNFNVPGVAPGGGNYSFRLGNNSWGCGAPQSGGGIFNPPTCPAQAESITIPLTVTADNAGFTYMFAAVMLNPQHEAAEQPRFETLVTTPDGQTVSCGYFLFVAGSGLAQFNNGPDNWQYTNWTQVGLDLTQYIGQVVTIEFRVAGCFPMGAFGGGNNAGQHSAYVYVDAFCQPFELESPAFCAGEASIEICAPDGFVNYNWPPGQPGIQPPLNQQCVTVLNPIAGTEYTVNMELITGCPTSTTVVLSGIPVTLTNDVTICAGQSVDLSVSVDDPTDGPYTFEWSNGVNGASQTVAPNATTTYTVITTGASGCGSEAEVTVEVEFCNHVVTVEGGETCPGGCVELEATLTNDLFPPYTYTWTGGIPDGPGPHSVCPTETTTYTVLVTDNNGDVATADVTVEILPVPVVSFDVTDVSCADGADGAATVLPTVGLAPFSHSWSTTPPQVGATASGLEAGSYTVTTTDDNGCSSSADVTIDEPTPLTVSFTSTPANCGESDGTATVTASGGAGTYSYAWATTPVQVTATSTGVPAGPISVTVTDANGCSVTDDTIVGSIGGAELSSTFTNATCNGFADGTATVIAANGTEPYSYSWNTVPVQIAATATGLAAGTYVATVTEGNGCIGFVQVVVGEPTAIVPTATSVPGSCGLPNATASASAIGGVGPYTYDWNTVPPQSGSTATGLLAGVYEVTVTDATGCFASTSVNVINVPGPLASFTTQDVCEGTVSTFTNTSVNGVTWQWDLGDGTLSTLQNVQHLYTSSGVFTVTLIATDGSGCSDTTTVDVVVTAVPTASFVGAPLQGCTPVTTTFINTGSSLGTNCLWNFGNGNTATQCETVAQTFVQAGCYDITLTVTEAGCSTQFTVPQMVCVDPLPIAAFSIAPNPVLISSPFAVFTSNSVGVDQFEWTFEGGQPATSDEPVVRVDYSAQDPNIFDVCLRVTNDAGCSDSACTTIFLRDDLRVHVPNTFTPDGDGINELFLPILAGYRSEDFRLTIFNRWGELIYETTDPEKGWDGTMGGTKVQDGVYIWKLVVRASIGVEIQEFTGHVNLLR